MVEEVDGMVVVAGEMGQGAEEVDVEVGHIHPSNRHTLHNLIGWDRTYQAIFRLGLGLKVHLVPFYYTLPVLVYGILA